MGEKPTSSLPWAATPADPLSLGHTINRSHADTAHRGDPGASTGPVTQAEHGVAFLLKQSGGVWT